GPHEPHVRTGQPGQPDRDTAATDPLLSEAVGASDNPARSPSAGWPPPGGHPGMRGAGLDFTPTYSPTRARPRPPRRLHHLARPRPPRPTSPTSRRRGGLTLALQLSNVAWGAAAGVVGARRSAPHAGEAGVCGKQLPGLGHALELGE